MTNRVEVFSNGLHDHRSRVKGDDAVVGPSVSAWSHPVSSFWWIGPRQRSWWCLNEPSRTRVGQNLVFALQTANHSRVAEPPFAPTPTMAPAESTNCVMFRIQLGFRDYLSRTLASWRTWGNTPRCGGDDGGHDSLPGSKSSARCGQFSHKGILHVRAFRFFLVMMPVLILIVSYVAWRAHTKIPCTTGSGALRSIHLFHW